MDRFTLEITLGNEEMQTTGAITDALANVIDRMHAGAIYGNIKDVNGQTVGKWACPPHIVKSLAERTCDGEDVSDWGSEGSTFRIM